MYSTPVYDNRCPRALIPRCSVLDFVRQCIDGGLGSLYDRVADNDSGVPHIVSHGQAHIGDACSLPLQPENRLDLAYTLKRNKNIVGVGLYQNRFGS